MYPNSMILTPPFYVASTVRDFSQTISLYYIICTRVVLSLISVKVVLKKQFPGKIYRTLALVEIVLNLPGNTVRIITKKIYLFSFSVFFIASSDHM